MATIGLKYPIVAVYDDTTGTPAYKNGMVMAKAMKVDLKWNKNDAELYADNALDEADASITGGTETLGINDLTYEVQALILGHKYNQETKELTVNENDVAPHVGHGFYGNVKRNGVEKSGFLEQAYQKGGPVLVMGDSLAKNGTDRDMVEAVRDYFQEKGALDRVFVIHVMNGDKNRITDKADKCFPSVAVKDPDELGQVMKMVAGHSRARAAKETSLAKTVLNARAGR